MQTSKYEANISNGSLRILKNNFNIKPIFKTKNVMNTFRLRLCHHTNYHFRNFHKDKTVFMFYGCFIKCKDISMSEMIIVPRFSYHGNDQDQYYINQNPWQHVQ